MKISLFKNFTEEVGNRTLPEIIEGIRGDHYRSSVLNIRALVESGHQEKANQLKKGLVAFTVSGLFEGGRKMSFLKSYNPMVILDIDKLDPKALPPLILKIKNIEFTKVVFISPSGRGLKIIVEVDSRVEMHKIAYQQVMDFYEKALSVQIDKSGKDITRLCFMSHDPEVYFNPESSIYKVLESKPEITKSQSASPDYNGHRAPANEDKLSNPKGEYADVFATCIGRTDEHMVFEVGNRNNYIYRLGVNCYHAGIPLQAAVEEGIKKFDFDNHEMERTIKNAYSWEPSPEINSSPKTIVKLPPQNPAIIDKEVFDQLPEILKRGCAAFEYDHERDFFFTGTLGLLGGMMPEVRGGYDGKNLYPNLYTLVVAPPATGKSVLDYARSLGSAYHLELKNGSRKAVNDYKIALSVYKKEMSKYLVGTLAALPEEPVKKTLQRLFIPGCASVKSLHHYLDYSEEGGIIFESDACEVARTLERELGNYSYLLRKAYDQRKVTISRKNSTGYMRLEKPKLSVVLAGTLSQAMRLIPTAKDGLFEQFLFYVFPGDGVWRNHSQGNKAENFEEQFKDLSKEVLELVRFLKKYPTEFFLKDEQWEKFNEEFRQLFIQTRHYSGNQMAQNLSGMGVICFKIAMILSALRKFEAKSTKTKLVCTDEDLEIAFQLSEIYWEHSICYAEQLPRQVDNFFGPREGGGKGAQR